MEYRLIVVWAMGPTESVPMIEEIPTSTPEKITKVLWKIYTKNLKSYIKYSTPPKLSTAKQSKPKKFHQQHESSFTAKKGSSRHQKSRSWQEVNKKSRLAESIVFRGKRAGPAATVPLWRSARVERNKCCLCFKTVSLIDIAEVRIATWVPWKRTHRLC